MTRVYDIHGYPCQPHDIKSNNSWFYVQKEGILVITPPNPATLVASHGSIISWRKVRQALLDHDKAKSRRRRK